MNENNIKKRLLVAEAEKWVGTREEGPNTGTLINMFQGWDNSPDIVPWCMAFVQYCLKEADRQYEYIVNQCTTEKHKLEKSEHCMTVWNNTKTQQRLSEPEPGCVVIWQHYKDGKATGLGHTGIVTEVEFGYFMTVEGNTSDGSGVDREGEGVYRKRRTKNNVGNMHLVGFLKPW